MSGEAGAQELRKADSESSYGEAEETLNIHLRNSTNLCSGHTW